MCTHTCSYGPTFVCKSLVPMLQLLCNGVYSRLLGFNVGGDDYSSQKIYITVPIPANEISTSFTINIIDDEIAECDETFALTISVPSSLCGVFSGSNDTSKVMIRDDDGRRSVSDYIVLLVTNRCNVVI